MILREFSQKTWRYWLMSFLKGHIKSFGGPNLAPGLEFNTCVRITAFKSRKQSGEIFSPTWILSQMFQILIQLRHFLTVTVFFFYKMGFSVNSSLSFVLLYLKFSSLWSCFSVSIRRKLLTEQRICQTEKNKLWTTWRYLFFIIKILLWRFWNKIKVKENWSSQLESFSFFVVFFHFWGISVIRTTVLINEHSYTQK